MLCGSSLRGTRTSSLPFRQPKLLVKTAELGENLVLSLSILVQLLANGIDWLGKGLYIRLEIALAFDRCG